MSNFTELNMVTPTIYPTNPITLANSANPITLANSANPITLANSANPITLAETNVVNNKNTFTYSDYNTAMLAKEADKLQNLNTTNNEESLYSNSKNFYNLSLNEVVNNTVLTVVAIFVDLLQLQKKYSKQPINYQDIFDIFTKGDRLIYFGVFLIFLSLLFMVLFISS